MLSVQYETGDDNLDSVLAHLGSESRLAIHAGHVMLFWDDVRGTAVPSLPNESVSNRLASAFAAARAFTVATWELGSQLHVGAAIRGYDVAHVILVNDWQFMPAGALRERARLEFYEQYADKRPSLLGTNDWTVLQQPVGHAAIRRSPFHSEKSLRNAYSRTHGRRASKECHVFAPAGLEPHSAPGCAEEVVELLSILAASNYSTFVNIYPLACRAHVLAGTEEHTSNGSGALDTIINVGVPVVDGSAHRRAFVTVHKATTPSGARARDD